MIRCWWNCFSFILTSSIPIIFIFIINKLIKYRLFIRDLKIKKCEIIANWICSNWIFYKHIFLHLLFHIFGYFTSLCICIFISTKILSPNKICIEERQSSHSFVSRKIIVDKILRKKRKKRRKRTIKSLSRNKASRSRRSIYQIGEWNEGTKETCRQKKKKSCVIHDVVQILYSPIETVIIRRYYLLFAPNFFLPLLFPDSSQIRRNDRIYRFSRPILVYLFYVSYRIEDPPPLCELPR